MLNFTIMLKILIAGFGLFFAVSIHAQDLIEVNGKVCTTDSVEFSGEKLVYFHNGNLAARYQFENGLLNEQVVFYFEGGGIRETGHYLNNEKHGTWTSYNQKGNIEAQGKFEEGVKDGRWLVFDEQGTCRLEIFYDIGQPMGYWTLFNEMAEVMEARYYP